jgi:hypothetical protein
VASDGTAAVDVQVQFRLRLALRFGRAPTMLGRSIGIVQDILPSPISDDDRVRLSRADGRRRSGSILILWATSAR